MWGNICYITFPCSLNTLWPRWWWLRWLILEFFAQVNIVNKSSTIVGKKWDPGILDPSTFSAKIRKVEARLWNLCKCYCATSSIPFAIMSCYCYCYCLETALQMLLCHTSSSHLLSCAVFRTKPVINRCKNSFSCQTLFGLIWQGQ